MDRRRGQDGGQNRAPGRVYNSECQRGPYNRAKITYALCQEDELCVCDIANILGVTVANASHHLRTLYKQRIVNYRKEGKLLDRWYMEVFLHGLIMFSVASGDVVLV